LFPAWERLVAGRERIYLDRFWNEFSATPKRFSEAARRHYAKLYARPGSMHAGFAQFATFDQDAVDNRAFVAAGKLDVPVLALGGEKSFGTTMGRDNALCGKRCGRRGCSRLRALDHGREPQGDHRAGSRFPRQGSIIPQAADGSSGRQLARAGWSVPAYPP